MPQVQVSIQKQFTLTLSTKEALWLKQIMQNHVEDEDKESACNREAFFNALPPFEELQDANV